MSTVLAQTDAITAPSVAYGALAPVLVVLGAALLQSWRRRSRGAS